MYHPLTQEEIRSRLTIPTGKLRLVIDTDAKNEVDDQFAIAWALRSKERFSVEAVYAAPFSHSSSPLGESEESTLASALHGAADGPAHGMEQSYQEILKLLSLLNEAPSGRVFRGSPGYLPAEGAIESDAVRDLIHRALESEEPLYVAAIAALTNVASALLMAPEIARKLVVVWLGGQPLSFGHGFEYNLYQDVRAVQVVLNSGVPLVHIPCMGVASLLTTTEDELRCRLWDRSEIGRYLAQNCLDAFRKPEASIALMALNRQGYLKGQADQSDAYFSQFPTQYVAWSRVIWDISTIAFLKNPNWVLTVETEAPTLNNDLTWDLTPRGRHLVRTATYCHRDMIFGDLFHALG